MELKEKGSGRSIQKEKVWVACLDWDEVERNGEVSWCKVNGIITRVHEIERLGKCGHPDVLCSAAIDF